MPQAIPFIVGALATEAAVSAGIVIAGSLGASLIGGAAAFVAGQLVNQALKPDIPPSPASGLAAPGGGRTQQVRQPVSPHQVIAGRVKVSGPILFIHSAVDDGGRANGYIYLIHALAGHQARAITDVYLDDNLSTDARYAGLVSVNLHTGEDDQAADSLFVGDIGSVWTTDHRLRGVTYLATRLKFNANAFPNGLPNVSAIVEGVADITDFRDDTVRWSNNPALFIAWWMMSPLGMNLAEDDLDLDSVIAAANVCDERVRVLSALDGSPPTADTTATVDAGSPDLNTITLAEGTRELDFGYGIRLSGPLPSGLAADTTYYVIPVASRKIQLATTHLNALDRIAITIGEPAGEIDVYYRDEPRYLINGQFTVDQARLEILQGMLSAMAGIAVYVGGKWFLYAGAPSVPSVTLSEDDLRGAMTVVPKRSMRDRFNSVRAVYVDPDANWQPVDAPPLVNMTYVEEDSQLVDPFDTLLTSSGGTVTTDGNYKIHVFNSSGTLEVSEDVNVWYLVIGGGGAGEVGGGGAGGYRENGAYDYALAAGTYSITVGRGGTPEASPGDNGTDSVFSTITATGGGHGGHFSDGADGAGGDGGSGGGGGVNGTSPFAGRAGGSGNTPSTSPPQGNDGGAGGQSLGTGSGGGGGGGAYAAGGDSAAGLVGGAGGDGIASSITGVSVTRAAGGGGTGYNTGGLGGTGGGGNGEKASSGGANPAHWATNGTANTGSGGGGGALHIAGSGGSGVVIVRFAYQTPQEQIDQYLYRDLRYPFTTSGRAVQRLMKIELERNRRQRIVQFPAKLTAMRLLPWEGMYLNHARYGFSAAQHRVVGWTLADDGGVDLALQADDSAVYDWDRIADEQTISPAQAVTVPDGSQPAPVFSIFTPTTADYATIRAAWFAPVGAVSYDLYSREVDDYPTYVFYGRIANNFADIGHGSVANDFKVRAIGANGAESEYAEDLAPVRPVSLAWSNPQISWHNGARAASVQVFSNVVDDFSSSSLVTTIAVSTDDQTYHPPGDGYYWLRSVNSTGNVSEQSASVHVTGLP